VNYLERISIPVDTVLWEQGEPSDGLYIIESGILRAIYRFANHTPAIEESMVPGTLAGELSALSNSPRNATVVVERQAVLWKLSIQNLRHLEADNPVLAWTFLQLVLKGTNSSDCMDVEINLFSVAKIDYDTLLSALAARQ
jgi:SulP family sulfate permease